MPPKKREFTPSVFAAWSKSQKARPPPRRFIPGEVVDISEEPADNTDPPAPKCSRTSSSRVQAYHNPRAIGVEEAGGDSEAASWLELPSPLAATAGDVDVLRRCLAANSALILAGRATALIAALFINFLRIFPRSRIVLCTGSNELTDSLREVIEEFGLSSAVFACLPQQQKLAESARIVQCSAPILERLVKKGGALIDELRLVVFHLAASYNASKFKRIVSQLILQKRAVRFISLGGGGSAGGSVGAISLRQKLIAAMGISDWIEPSPHEFRFSSPPTHVTVLKWIEEENGFMAEEAKRLEQVIERYLSLERPEWLPSSNPKELLFMPFDLMNKEYKDEFPGILVSLYRAFLLNGSSTFKRKLDELTRSSESLQLRLLALEEMAEALEGASAVEGIHAKMKLLRSRLESHSEEIAEPRVVVLCEDWAVAASVAEYLRNSSFNPSLPILLLGSPESPFTRLSSYLQINPSAVLILSIDNGSSCALDAVESLTSQLLSLVISTSKSCCFELVNFFSGEHVALLNEEYEKIREMRGVELAVAASTESVRGAVAVSSFSFQLEPSALHIPAHSMKLRPTLPASSQHISLTVHDFALSSVEHSVLCRRLSGCQSAVFPCCRFPPDPFILSVGDVLWNDQAQSPSFSSSLTRLFTHQVSSSSPEFPPPADSLFQSLETRKKSSRSSTSSSLRSS